MATDINKLFELGLHKLSTDKLIKLSEQQEILLKRVETANLVYLVQELAARVEILQDKLDAPANAVVPEGH